MDWPVGGYGKTAQGVIVDHFEHYLCLKVPGHSNWVDFAHLVIKLNFVSKVVPIVVVGVGFVD